MTGYGKRFSGVSRLYGKAGLECLRRSHVCVVGIGGVGSWAVEALARSGVGELTLVDMDDVCISNVNRQLPALNGTFGRPKVDAMAERVRSINPDCAVHPVQSFFLRSNADEILSGPFDFVLDAIDTLGLKILLISMCRERNLPIVVTGGAAGRRDPTQIQVSDLAFSSHCNLLQEVRRGLRRHHWFPRGTQAFGVECVFSRESPVFPQEDGTVCATRPDTPDLRLDCNSGLGTASFVTGAFGLTAASRVVAGLCIEARHPHRAVAPGPATARDEAVGLSEGGLSA
jgi:tRNA threonylcarbamoyladenosine dehydratase